MRKLFLQNFSLTSLLATENAELRSPVESNIPWDFSPSVIERYLFIWNSVKSNEKDLSSLAPSTSDLNDFAQSRAGEYTVRAEQNDCCNSSVCHVVKLWACKQAFSIVLITTQMC